MILRYRILQYSFWSGKNCKFCSKLLVLIVKADIWVKMLIVLYLLHLMIFFLPCSGEGVPKGAGMEEPLYWIRTGSVYVPHWEDKGARPQGDSWEHERGALAAFLWWGNVQDALNNTPGACSSATDWVIHCILWDHTLCVLTLDH